MTGFLWKTQLDKSYYPPWPCPACEARISSKRGIVRLVKNSLAFHEKVPSLASRAEDESMPERTEYVFIAWGKCSNLHCNQMFAITRIGGMREYNHSGWMEIGDEEREFIEDTGIEEYFIPVSCYPMHSLIQNRGFHLQRGEYKEDTNLPPPSCRSVVFERRTTIVPPHWTEEGWLKRRTDKFFGVCENDAKKIVAGLNKK